MGDGQFYKEVDFSLHTTALLFFCLYLIIYYLILKVTLCKSIISVNKKNLNILFLFVLLILLLQIYFAVVFGAGVASNTNKSSSAIEYILLIFSFDGVYYAYALKEKNKNRLLWATVFYCISNIVRGWAGFVIFLAVIYFIRQGKIDLKKVIFLVLIIILLIPILLFSREIFRSGISNIVFLTEFNILELNFFLNYLLDSLKLIIVRFDFYSNYIGVSKMGVQAIADGICLPIQENIVYKLLIFLRWADSCIALGSALPGSLDSFFADKGTSFLISSGFFALPIWHLIIYFLSFVFVLVFSSLFVKHLMIYDEYNNFFLVLVFLLLLQGWMYQFLYTMTGFIFGWFLSRINSKNTA